MLFSCSCIVDLDLINKEVFFVPMAKWRGLVSVKFLMPNISCPIQAREKEAMGG